MITKAQYVALCKWSDGKQGNQKAYRVREDVCHRLKKAGHLLHTSFLMESITDKGREALLQYENKHKIGQTDE